MLIGHVRGVLGRMARAAGLRPVPTGDGRAPTEASNENIPESGPPQRDWPSTSSTTERIARMVEENGGRIEQATIVSRLECSAATVSRRLGEMEDAGEVVRYTVGRKKIVCHPDQLEQSRPGVRPRDSTTRERISS